VIAGKYRSRPLKSLPGLDLRPTADRLRETLFNVLTPGNPDALAGSIWVDLFAGTGAVGIEALSRGASMVYFVESAPAAAELIRKNLKSLGLESGFEVLKMDTIRALRSLESRNIAPRFVFLDPPYQMENEYRRTLAYLAESRLLTDETIVIAEHQKKLDPGEAVPLGRFRKLQQGDASLSLYRLSNERQSPLVP
jgi:16S rRNA (guanine(966)-N(2))-methyltransferase RsmD